MRIVLLAHPGFMRSQSMPRFAGMLEAAYRERGHEVKMWAPEPRLYRLMSHGPLSKWAGYADQYLLFPAWLRQAAAREPDDTVFVLTDQAQGPWAPLLRHRPLVVHAHDLLALRSALGEVPQNPTGFTGRLYQRFIRRGFERSSHFICISQRTRDDLQRLSSVQADQCTVVHNGLNFPYRPMPPSHALRQLEQAGHPATARGLLLHVSGNQWYKNVAGVVRMYAQYARTNSQPLPLWLVGVPRDAAVNAALAALPAQAEVRFLHRIDNDTLQAAYSMARAFLFPSLAEGFGWPIVEAQACGCPVITTDDAPMNEIAGPEAHLLPLLRSPDDLSTWATHAAGVLQRLLDVPEPERLRRSAACAEWAQRFEPGAVIERYLSVYRDVLAEQNRQLPASIPVKEH